MNLFDPIGVFDSGLGGLTVLSELVKILPNENFIYLGDTARVPYGGRSSHIIQRYSLENTTFLLRHPVKMIVIACNTASAHAEKEIRLQCDSIQYDSIPVIGMIQPGVDSLLRSTKNKRVGIAATNSTIKSKAYQKRILEKEPSTYIFSKPCPLLVPLVEEGWIDKKITRLVIQEYFSEFIREEVDTVVLGCTHYPLLKSVVKEEFPNIELVDSSQETAEEVRKRLKENEIISSNSSSSTTSKGKVSICLTDITNQMNYLESFLAGVGFDVLEEVRLPIRGIEVKGSVG